MAWIELSPNRFEFSLSNRIGRMSALLCESTYHQWTCVYTTTNTTTKHFFNVKSCIQSLRGLDANTPQILQKLTKWQNSSRREIKEWAGTYTYSQHITATYNLWSIVTNGCYSVMEFMAINSEFKQNFNTYLKFVLRRHCWTQSCTLITIKSSELQELISPKSEQKQKK